jgi:urease accessory protein
MMMLGAAIGFGGVHLGAVEQVIAASVCVFGLVLSSTRGLPMAFCMALTGCFAIFHGYAHATEAIGSDAFLYMTGFVVSTALLHAIGFGVAMLLSQRAQVIRWLGAVMAVSGAAMLLG